MQEMIACIEATENLEYLQKWFDQAIMAVQIEFVVLDD
jgi:hypothetical protein